MSRQPYQRPKQKEVTGVVFNQGSAFENTEKDKKEEVRKFRREASRLASLANKRVERLQKNDLTTSPAYKGYIDSGGGRFGVKGKTYNEVQAEVARMNAFINAKTSTIQGINTNLKEIADNTGIEYSNMEDLRKKADKFFELSSKVEQYLRQVEDMASAIGYQKIWEAVNVYTDANKIDLSKATNDVDEMIEQITKALTEHQDPERIIPNMQLDDDPDFWFQLPLD